MSAITGKRIRLNRLIQAETNTCLICAIDHGMTSPQFLSGLYDTGARVREAIAGGANVLMLGRGMAKKFCHLFQRDTSLALMLTASAAGRPSGAVITPSAPSKKRCALVPMQLWYMWLWQATTSLRRLPMFPR